jgi:hypothetical protein
VTTKYLRNYFHIEILQVRISIYKKKQKQYGPEREDPGRSGIGQPNYISASERKKKIPDGSRRNPLRRCKNDGVAAMRATDEGRGSPREGLETTLKLRRPSRLNTLDVDEQRRNPSDGMDADVACRAADKRDDAGYHKRS